MAPALAGGDVRIALAALVGAAAVRPATTGDAIDEVRPSVVVEPEDAAGVASVLAWASTHRVPTVIRGGGTRLSWGRVPAPFEIVLGTGRLTRILHHEPGDLTVSVEGGLTVAALNRALSAHGQWLPLDVPSEASTIGGAIAVNDSGPLRHRHGAPRDQLIGIQIATTDGRIAKAGGNVVKNVAGYDLGRLVCGSFGSFAAIVGATFKLAPIPAASATLAADFSNPADLAGGSAAIAGSQIDPLCADVHVHATSAGDASYRLLVCLAGTDVVNEIQAENARRLISTWRPSRFEILMDRDESEAWREQTRGPWTSAGTLLRMNWRPATLALVAATIAELARAHGATSTLTGRAALGAGLLRLDGEPHAQAATIEALRARTELVSHVVIARAATALKTTVDAWGPPGEAQALLQRIKDTLDPNHVLNGGRGVI